jgi:putative FmdB family regulatory protein
MPIYVYKCDTCDNVKEVITTRINQDIVLENCECGGTFQKAPSISTFKINGYSYENGYSSPEDISYDGKQRAW